MSGTSDGPGRWRAELARSGLAWLTTAVAALTFSNLLRGWSWWWLPAASAAAVCGVAGLVGRLLRFPIWLLPACYALAAAWYLPAVSAPQTRRFGLPTADTWTALRSLADSGVRDIRRLAAPVPERPGILLLFLVFVVVVAAFVDVLVVAARRPALAGLPLLGFLAVPAAAGGSRGIAVVPFVLTAVVFIGLLYVDGAALRGPGRLSRAATRPQPQPSQPGVRRAATFGAQVTLIAVVAALVGAAVIPRAPGLKLSRHDSNGPTKAFVVEPLVTVNQQLTSPQTVTLLTVDTTRPDYLRLTALDRFDGLAFRLQTLGADEDGSAGRQWPTVAGVGGEQERVHVQADEDFAERYLPVPYQPVRVHGVGEQWRLDTPTSTVFATGTDTRGLSYTVDSFVAEPSATDLASIGPIGNVPASIAPDLQLPMINPAVRALTRRVVGNAATPYAAAMAIQTFLRGPDFRYSLTQAPSGPDPLARFLLTSRTGYCQQFASAMAVMARLSGIPARVAVGFTVGQFDGQHWVITNRDAHAWPELWFPKLGWLRFEPTRRDDSTEVAPSYAAPVPVSSGSPGATNATPTAGPQPGARDPGAGPSGSTAPGTLPSPTAQPAGHGSGWSATLVAVVVGVGLLALLVGAVTLPMFLRWRRRRQRLAATGTGRDHGGAWQEVVDSAIDLGYPVPSSASPRRVATMLTADGLGQHPDAGRAAVRLALAEEQRRYAPPAGLGTRGVGVVAVADVRLVLQALRDAAEPRSRWRATCRPASMQLRGRRRPAGWRGEGNRDRRTRAGG